MKSSITLAFIFGMSCFSAGAVENSPDAVADSQPDYSDTLLGDWGGRRGSMSAQGYDWEIVYKLDLLSKTAAPSQASCQGNSPARCFNTYALDNLDIKLSLDGEKIAGLKGSSGLLYILSNHGGKPALKSDPLRDEVG